AAGQAAADHMYGFSHGRVVQRSGPAVNAARLAGSNELDDQEAADDQRKERRRHPWQVLLDEAADRRAVDAEESRDQHETGGACRESGRKESRERNVRGAASDGDDLERNRREALAENDPEAVFRECMLEVRYTLLEAKGRDDPM